MDKEQKEKSEEEEGDSSPESPLERAERLEKSLREQNDRFESNIRKMEEIQATNMLSGKASAGTPNQKKEETPQEYKDRVMRGDV